MHADYQIAAQSGNRTLHLPGRKSITRDRWNAFVIDICRVMSIQDVAELTALGCDAGPGAVFSLDLPFPQGIIISMVEKSKFLSVISSRIERHIYKIVNPCQSVTSQKNVSILWICPEALHLSKGWRAG